LTSSRKKKETANQNNDSDRHSISEFSSTGQHSVASKTVDSGTTIKASNRHQGQGQDQTKSVRLSATLMGRNFQNENTSVAPSGKRQQNNTSIRTSTNKPIRPPKPWKSLKRLVVKGRHHKHQSASITSQSSSSLNLNSPEPFIPRRHAKSHDGAESLFPSKFPLNNGYPMRKRFYSEGVETMPLSQQKRLETMSFSGGSTRASELQLQHAMDQVIRGRLDGIDVLSLGLGPAVRASEPVVSSTEAATATSRKDVPTQKSTKSDSDNPADDNAPFSFDPRHTSFTNLESTTSPAKLIEDMIWTSAGMDHPEIIFEGYYPGGSDRWGVRIATLLSSSPSPSEEQSTRDPSKDPEYDGDAPALLPTSNLTSDNHDGDESTASNTTDNDGSINLPMAELWDSLWGVVAATPPIPSHMNMQTMAFLTTAKTASTVDEDEDPLFPECEEHQQFATCNVPIDLDDDAFMIENRHHVKSVHELVMVPLQARRFDSAVSIFEKLQRGLDGNKKYIHLVASTSHNIGMIQLCQGKYREALESFRKAVQIRKDCLPDDHPDIAVSLQRKGMSHFALSSPLEALKCFEAALAICTSADNARAKILNNIGVARYQLEDYAQALKSFTSALEIQRPWLEGPVRRESIVYSASTILSNMGKVYLRKGDNDLAYFVFEEACLMQTSIVRKDHDIVLRSLDNMARAHAKNGNYAEALRIFTSLHRSQEARFGPNNDVCIETLGVMGIVHFRLLDYEEAEKCMHRVEAWQLHKGGMDETHRSVKLTTEHIRQIKRCIQGKEPMWV